MRAAEYFDGRFTVADVAEPPVAGPGQLRIKVAACGICGSDLSMSKDPCRFVEVAAGAGYPFAVFDATRPVVLGHEWAGTVVETGPGVEDFAEGDRVTGLGITTEQGTGMPTIIGYSNEYHGPSANSSSLTPSGSGTCPTACRWSTPPWPSRSTSARCTCSSPV